MMYYRRGTVATTTPWGRPTPDKIRRWAWAMQPLTNSVGVDCWITGRAVWAIDQARDLDIVYTGAYSSISDLELLLNTAVAQGLAEDMLVDCKWAESAHTVQGVEPADIGFIWTDYWAQDTQVRNYRTNPAYTPVGPGSVRGNFRQLGGQLRPHQLEYILQHGAMPVQRIEDFVKEYHE
jgi:hypothetical protein